MATLMGSMVSLGTQRVSTMGGLKVLVLGLSSGCQPSQPSLGWVWSRGLQLGPLLPISSGVGFLHQE